MPHCRGFVSAVSGAPWPLVGCSAIAVITVPWWNARERCMDLHHFCLAHRPEDIYAPAHRARAGAWRSV
jgi:hypothetical protein